MLWPSRKINLGDYNSAELNAGIEMVFPEPVDADGKEVLEAYDMGRKLVREELRKQYEPYRKIETNKNK